MIELGHSLLVLEGLTLVVDVVGVVCCQHPLPFEGLYMIEIGLSFALHQSPCNGPSKGNWCSIGLERCECAVGCLSSIEKQNFGRWPHKPPDQNMGFHISLRKPK